MNINFLVAKNADNIKPLKGNFDQMNFDLDSRYETREKKDRSNLDLRKDYIKKEILDLINQMRNLRSFVHSANFVLLIGDKISYI